MFPCYEIGNLEAPKALFKDGSCATHFCHPVAKQRFRLRAILENESEVVFLVSFRQRPFNYDVDAPKRAEHIGRSFFA